MEDSTHVPAIDNEVHEPADDALATAKAVNARGEKVRGMLRARYSLDAEEEGTG